MRKLVLAAAALLALLALAASPAAARKPLLKNACKLVRNAEIERLMGHAPVRRRGYPQGCVWTTRIPPGTRDDSEGPEEASISLTGFASVRQAKEYVRLMTDRDYCEFDPLLPDRRLGDEAYLDSCGSNVMFRLGRVVGDVATFTNGVVEGTRADTRRTVGLTRKAAPRLRRYRCGPPLCP